MLCNIPSNLKLGDFEWRFSFARLSFCLQHSFERMITDFGLLFAEHCFVLNFDTQLIIISDSFPAGNSWHS